MKKRSVLGEIKRLSALDMHDSAILLASLHLSKTLPGPRRALARCALGNALRSNAEHRRALQSYQEALHEISHTTTTNITESLFGMEDAEDLILLFDDDHNSAESQEGHKRARRSNELCLVASSIKYRIALCLCALRREDEAISLLSEVRPLQDLPACALALLGRLKHKRGFADRGLPAYKLALGKERALLAVTLALADHAECDLEELVSEDMDLGVAQLVRAHALAGAHRNAEALQAFAQYDVSPHVLLQMGKLELQRGNREAALDLFQRARKMDPHSLDSADIYASLLRGLGDGKRLVELTNDLLAQNITHRPEPWIASALLAEMTEDREKALRYSTKALECDALHLPALHFRSALLLSQNRALESLSSWNKAFTLKRDFNACKGLVDCYLALSRGRDAITMAQECVELMPHDVRAYVLLARALAAAHMPPSKDSLLLACASLDRALRLDPDSLPACMQLGEIRLVQFQHGLVQSSEVANTARLMRRALHCKPGVFAKTRDVVLCRIASMFLAVGHNQAALEHYSEALAWNSACADALDALEQLEQQMEEDGNSKAAGSNRSTAAAASTPNTSLKRSPPPAFRLMMSARGRDSM